MKYLFLFLLIANVYGQTDTIFVTDTLFIRDTVVFQGVITVHDTVEIPCYSDPSAALCLALYGNDWTERELCDMFGFIPMEALKHLKCDSPIIVNEIVNNYCPVVTNLIENNLDNGSTSVLRYDVKGRTNF